MFRRWILPILCILALAGLGAFLVVWRRPPRPEPPPPPPPPAQEAPVPDDPFGIVFGGELGGRIWLPPCSKARQGGPGLAASAIDTIRQESGFAMVLDTGDLAAAPGTAGGAEYAAGLEFLRMFLPAFLAVGERDLALGLDVWREKKNRHGAGVWVLCANLRDEQDRALVPGASPLLVGRTKTVVAAVLSPSYEKGLREAGVPVRLLPAAASVRAALKAEGPADFVVLLAHVPWEEARALVRELPEVDAVIAPHVPMDVPLRPEVIDGRRLFPAASGWRLVGAAAFQNPGGGQRPVFLDGLARPAGGSIGPGSPLKFIVDGIMAKSREPGVLEAALRGNAVRDAVPAYTGPEACAACHPVAHGSWSREGAPHARSMEKVLAQGFSRTWQCLPCHTTAPGRKGGHLVPADSQAAVTCEACHGPGAAHAADEGKSRLADPRASCASCHVLEMSPGFKFEEKWPKAEHGR